MDLNNSKQPSSEPGDGPRNSNLDDLITTFVDITTSTADEARFFLESHNFDLDAAVSTFLESSSAPSPAVDPLPISTVVAQGNLPRRRRRSTVTATATTSPSASDYKESSDSESDADSDSDSPVRLRSRSPSPATRSRYSLRARGSAAVNGAAAAAVTDGAVAAAAVGRKRNSNRVRPSGRRGRDLNRKGKGEDEEEGKDSDEDEEDPDWMMPEDDNASGEGGGGGKSEKFDWPTEVDTDEVFERARRFEAAPHPSSDQSQPSSSSRSFSGTMRKLTGETKESSKETEESPKETTHVVTLWKNGFTVNDGPLRRFDNHENVMFIENLKRGHCPRELVSPNNQTGVHVDLVKRNENHPEPKIQKPSFVGSGRTLGSTSDTPPLPPSNSASTSTTSSSVCTPNPSSGLVVDENLPTTSIQLRLVDGTRLIAQFNLHHTIRDLHAFINSSRPGDGTSYKLQAMGFPPKQLTDMDQTIEEAGLASSVVIQKF